MSLNLHAAVRGAISSVNGDIQAVILRSQGYSTDADGSQRPKYLAAQNVTVQVQPLSGGALKHADYLNLQGVLRSVYLFGDTQGVIRPLYKGGDLLQFSEYPGQPLSTWLITEVLETWAPGWSHVIATLQTDKTPS